MSNFTDVIKTINHMPEALAAEQYEAMKFDRRSWNARSPRGKGKVGHINQFLLKNFLINPGEQKIII